jgi:NAD-dependent DNA ligase
MVQHFFSIIKPPGTGPHTIKNLHAKGVQSVGEFFQYAPYDAVLAQLQADLTKPSPRTRTGEHSSEPITCVKLMIATNSFGPGLGHKRLTDLMAIVSNNAGRTVWQKLRGLKAVRAGNNNLEQPQSSRTVESITTSLMQAAATAQVSIPSAAVSTFVQRFPYFLGFLQDNMIPMQVLDACPLSMHGHSSNRENKPTVVFSGFRDASLEEYIRHAGGVVTDTVNKKTSFVIIEDHHDNNAPAQTRKTARALELNIPIIQRSKARAHIPV